ncbi:hypothetical protein DFH06DRAFT_1130210 [Mycena polygramma]|nr:hypothetical protein DFH06DRAFT_1130210 [Mycena polygramma]
MVRHTRSVYRSVFLRALDGERGTAWIFTAAAALGDSTVAKVRGIRLTSETLGGPAESPAFGPAFFREPSLDTGRTRPKLCVSVSGNPDSLAILQLESPQISLVSYKSKDRES